MTDSFFSGETLDDLMRIVMNELFSNGEKIVASKGPTIELTGLLLELKNPRARLSRTETRGKPFSCLGELCWYLAGSDELGFISYYIPLYKESADGETVFGAYGPKLFDWNGINQVENVTNILKKKPTSRQAVIQLFDRGDIVGDHKHVSCTCTFQFMNRSNRLNMITHMRSNDAFLGLTHDVFCFSMLQEIIARDLSLEIGTYRHAVGSLHLYKKNEEAAKQFLNEGWQPTNLPMPPMPKVEPWPAIRTLLEAEAIIREGGSINEGTLESLDPYWVELIRLLQVFRYCKEGDADRLSKIRESLLSSVYLPFVDARLKQFK